MGEFNSEAAFSRWLENNLPNWLSFANLSWNPDCYAAKIAEFLRSQGWQSPEE